MHEYTVCPCRKEIIKRLFLLKMPCYTHSREIHKLIHFIMFLPQVPGQFLSLFYTDRLGLYPHVDLTSRKQFNGGIPQRGNLKASTSKARADINYYIPSKWACLKLKNSPFVVWHIWCWSFNFSSSCCLPSRTSHGLAVIDWEEWRPLWDRNWGSKKIYQTLSVAHVMHTNHSLTVQQATETAKQKFQVRTNCARIHKTKQTVLNSY